MRYIVTEKKEVDFGGMDKTLFLVGLINEFSNKFQAAADQALEEVSWKQYFMMVCVQECDGPPAIRELADRVGSSHQNVKQMLIKLEEGGFVQLVSDETDRRKQRVKLTGKGLGLLAKNDFANSDFMQKIFKTIKPKQVKNSIKTILQLDENMNDNG